MNERDDIPAELRDVAARVQALGREEWDLAEPPALRVAVPARERRRRRAPLMIRPAVAAAAAIALVVLGAAGGALLTRGGAGAGGGREVALAPVGDGPRGAHADARLARASMHLTVSGLPRVGGGGFYEVWMLRDPAHLVALGSFRVGPGGRARVDLPVTASARRFPVLDISREPADGDPAHSGHSVLRSRRSTASHDHLGSAPMSSLRPARPAHRPRPVRLRDGSRGRLPRGRLGPRRGHDRRDGLVWARVPGTADGPTLAVVGHIDEIGLIVTHIDDEGFLRFTGVGGWDPQVLVGQRISVATREGAILGVVGRKPIHLLKDDDRKKVARLDELHIDIGAKDGDEARAVVRIGDVAVIEVSRSSCPTIARSRARWTTAWGASSPMRSRGSSPAGGAPGDVVAVAAVQEETSFGGSTRRPTGCAPTWPSSSTSPTPPTRPASRSTRSGRTRSARAR